MENDILTVDFQGKKLFVKKSEWDLMKRWEEKQMLMVQNGAANPNATKEQIQELSDAIDVVLEQKYKKKDDQTN